MYRYYRPTGSGKSTIISLISRLYDIDRGEILIGGINVKDLKLKELRENIGIVLQDSILLSGGQRQRLSIARTLVRNPKILIMDDSSSALDMKTQAKLQETIKNRKEETTVITIAQRISAVIDSDKIIVLDEGKISAIGSHEELIKTNEMYRSIAVSQLGEEMLLNV